MLKSIDLLTWKRITVSVICALVILCVWLIGGEAWQTSEKFAVSVICAAVGIGCWWIRF